MKSFSKSKFVFLGLVVLAFSLRSIFFYQTIKFIQPGTGSDAHFYLEWAKDIVGGDVLGRDVFYALPLYPYFLSLVYLFSGGKVFGLMLIQMLIGAINCGLIYILAKKLFNNQAGITASIIACGYLMFIFYDRMILPTSLAILLGLLLALLLLKVRDNPGSRGWFGAGLLLGLCTLTRASFLLLAIFIFFWIIFECKKGPLSHPVLYCSSFILPFLLIIGAITLRNYLVARDPVLITAHSGINFYIGNNPRADGFFSPPPYMRATQSGLIEDARIVAEKMSARRLKASEVSNFWFRKALNFIRSQPLNYLKLLGRKFVLFWNGRERVDDIEFYIFSEEAGHMMLPLFRFSLICPLALLGMFLAWPKRSMVMLLYLFVFSLTLATISFFVNSRYRLMVVPYLIIFAGQALWHILKMCKNRQYRNFIFSLALFFALYFLTNIKVTDAALWPNPVVHYSKGVILSDQGRYQEALKEYQAALKINPYDFMSYFGLGNVYYQLRDFAQATDNYKRALAVNPYFYKAHFNLGIIYKESGRKNEAEERFEEVLRFRPEDCAAHYNLGRILQERGLIELALKEYEQALKIEPGRREILKAIEEITMENR